MADGGDRSIIDEKGRLFGLVNIVDVLVILLVLAIVIGGVAVALSGDSDSEPDGSQADPPPTTNGTNVTNVTNVTRYVTLDFGRQPAYVADNIEVGQQWPQTESREQFTITDVYLSGRFNDQTTVVVRARVNGTTNESHGTFKYRNDPLYLGDALTLTTNEVQIDGTVTALEDDGDSLSRTNATVTVVTTERPQIAGAIAVGDEYRVGGKTIAEITGVQREDVEESERERVYLDVRVLAIERGSIPEFAGRALRLGTSIPFSTDRYQLGGEIVAIQESDDG